MAHFNWSVYFAMTRSLTRLMPAKGRISMTWILSIAWYFDLDPLSDGDNLSFWNHCMRSKGCCSLASNGAQNVFGVKKWKILESSNTQRYSNPDFCLNPVYNLCHLKCHCSKTWPLNRCYPRWSSCTPTLLDVWTLGDVAGDQMSCFSDSSKVTKNTDYHGAKWCIVDMQIRARKVMPRQEEFEGKSQKDAWFQSQPQWRISFREISLLCTVILLWNLFIKHGRDMRQMLPKFN